jgi:hypothetical protein
MLASTKTTPRRPDPHGRRLLKKSDLAPCCMRVDLLRKKFHLLFILIVGMQGLKCEKSPDSFRKALFAGPRHCHSGGVVHGELLRPADNVEPAPDAVVKTLAAGKDRLPFAVHGSKIKKWHRCGSLAVQCILHPAIHVT